MNWLVDIGLFALVGICSYFGIEHHLDSKANKLGAIAVFVGVGSSLSC